jgi:hypothetical protein
VATSGVGWLQWQPAVVMATVSAIVGFALWRVETGWLRGVGAFTREFALVLALYTIWILAGRFAIVRVDEGLANGRWVYQAERWLRLPDETGLQNWLLAHPWPARLTNGYYAIVHAPAMMITLLWLFLSHRDKYSKWRVALAITTLSCLVIQYVPVAPPRMFPQFGYVDVARVFGQSVYPPLGQGINDQLSAMPSVHVAWALWVGVVVVDAASSRFRWFVLAHPVATMFAVVATANHWWADGIVAGALLALAALVDTAVRRSWRAWRNTGAVPAVDGTRVPPELQPALASAGANDAFVGARPMSTSSGSRRSST